LAVAQANSESPARAGLRGNHQRILGALGRSTGLSRGDLAEQLGLPKATVAGLVDELIGRGLVSEGELRTRPGAAGRPARLVTLTGPPPSVGVLVWSAGLLRVAVASLAGELRAEHTIEMAPQGELDGLLEPGLRLLRRAAKEAGTTVAELANVVLGVPAPFQRGVGMAVPVPTPAPMSSRRSQYVPWLRADPAGELARRTGTTATVENDANLGALGESVFGAGRGLDSLVYIKLGRASMGAGLIINGRLHRGASGFAGELAHIQVHDGGVLCACGGRGCLINDIGPGLAGLVAPAYPGPLTFEDMLTRADEGDPGLRRVLGDLGRTIGRPLADLCTMLNPAAIVVDGAVGPAGRYIIEGLREMVSRHAAPVTADAVRIVPGELGAHADLLGAVALVRDEQDHPR